MGASPSTLEKDVEASITELFANNIYRNETRLSPVSGNNHIRTSLEPDETDPVEQLIDTPEFLTINSPEKPSDNYNADYRMKIHRNISNHTSIHGLEENNQVSGRDVVPAVQKNPNYLVLYKAALKGDWEKAKAFLSKHPDAKTARITKDKETALHVAARSGHSVFVENLLKCMPQDAIKWTDKSENEYTALHLAAISGITRVAKALVEASPILTQIPDEKYGWVPLLIAAYNNSSNKHKEMVEYLCEVTKDDDCEGYENPFSGKSGGDIIYLTTASSSYDIALSLLKRFPRFAAQENVNGAYALEVISNSAFPSGSQLTTFQCFIHSLFGTQKIHTENSNHKKAMTLVKRFCEEIAKQKDDQEIIKLFSETNILWHAVKSGIVEAVMEYIQICPDLIWLKLARKSILQLAIQHRRANIYTLVCGMMGDRLKWSYSDDGNEGKSMNKTNILHLAAKKAPSDRLNTISGAAFQMQWELQWYNEVQKFALERHQTKQNKDGQTSQELFTNEHEDLRKSGEEWMKGTAASCSLVAALIATVVFAAAFTVPGGNISDSNNSNNGTPIFLNKTSFMVFTVTNALALYSSITSVIIFLSILTARYAEQDFLKSLPGKLIIGLAFLFFSIATMIVAFTAALSLVFEHKMAWVLFFIGIFALVPLSLFLWWQLPLFVKMFKSTYGGSIFDKQRQCMPCNWEYQEETEVNCRCPSSS